MLVIRTGLSESTAFEVVYNLFAGTHPSRTGARHREGIIVAVLTSLPRCVLLGWPANPRAPDSLDT